MEKEKMYDLLNAKALEGNAGYGFRRLQVSAYLTRYDPLLVELKTEAFGTSNAAITKWREASAKATGTSTLLLSDAVQIREISVIGGEKKDYA